MSRHGRLLPYETIVKAHEGDPKPWTCSFSHYAGYIPILFQNERAESMPKLRDYVEKERLIACLLKFQFDYPPDEP